MDSKTPLQRITGKRNLTNDLTNAAIALFIVLCLFGLVQAM